MMITDNARLKEYQFLLKSLVGLICAAYIGSVSSNFASYLSPLHNEPLQDLGFYIIPEIHFIELTDIVTNGLVIITAIKLLLMHKTHKSLFNLALIMQKLSLGFIIRSFRYFASRSQTIMPKVLIDCMFSGHALILVIIGCYWWKQKTATGILTASISAFGIIILIANRAHYTMDVLVAIYIALALDYFIENCYQGQQNQIVPTTRVLKQQMKVYKDIFTNDELVADSYKFTEVEGVVYEVDCSLVTDAGVAIKIGANASAEGEDADDAANDPSAETFIDVIRSSRLCETGFTKKDYLTYIKSYMKKVEAQLQKSNPERVELFKAGAAKYVKKVLERFDEYSFYLGENCDMDGMVVLMDYRENGTTPYCVFWIDGMVGEKY